MPLAPFKGLAPFQDTDEDVRFFFGREREREVIEANLMASRLTILYGEPGVGKTSALRAGVAHHLRATSAANLAARGEPGLAVVVFDDWRDDPVRGLRAAVADAVTRALGGSVSPEDEARSLVDACRLWQQLLDGDLYVVLDQTEQYFLYHGAESGPGTFAQEFPAAVGSADLRINFLLAIREDALAKLDSFRPLIPGVLDNYLRIEHLDPEAARAAIVGPIAAYNGLVPDGDAVEIETGLVDAVLEQVVTGKVDVGTAGRGAIAGENGDVRIETPYLQLVMRRLWDEERARESRTLHLATLLRLGGAEQIVRDHVELALGSLTPEEMDVAAKLFDHLVTPSGTKIAHESRDLAEYAGTTEANVLPVLTKLGDERILRSTAGADVHGSRYEIFHDVLAEPVLAWRARHEQTRALEKAEALARAKHRRLAIAAAVALLAFLVMAGLTVFAFSQQSRAKERERTARSRALAASALTQIDVDPELALLLARDAAAVQDTPSVDGVLRTALIASRVRRVAHLGGSVLAVDVPNHGLAAATRRAIALLDTRLHVQQRVRTHGRLVGVGGGDALYQTGSRLELRRLADGRLDRRVPLEQMERIDLAALDGEGRLVALTGGGARVEIVDARSGRSLGELVQSSPVTAIAFGPGRELLATGAEDGTVSLWSLDTHRQRWRAHYLFHGHVGAVRDIAFSPHGALVASGSQDGTARVFQATDGSTVAVMSGHTNPIAQVAFSPDGTRIVTASLDGTARVWKVDTGAQLVVLPGHRGPVIQAAFVDNSYVATGGEDGTVRLWYVLVEPELHLLAQLPRPVERARFLSARRIEAVTSDNRAHIFSLNGKQAAVAPARPRPFPRSALGAAATRRGNTVQIREPDGRAVLLRGHTAPVTSVRFSSDGKLVVTASRDATARIWNAATGRPLHTLRGHFGVIDDASFSPDGRWVVTAGPSTAALWSAATGERVFYLRGHLGPVTSASFDPRGTAILTSGIDGTVRTYDCEVCRSGPALLAVANRRLAATGRTLSAAEQKAFGS